MESNNQVDDKIKTTNKKRVKGIAKYIQSDIAYKFCLIDMALATLNNNESIRNKLSFYGYDAAKVAELQKIYDVLRHLISNCKDRHALKLAAHREFLSSFAVIKKDFADTLKITRVAIKKDPVMLSQLGISTPVRRDYAGTFHTMQNFYDNMLKSTEIMQAMSVFGYSARKITGLREAFIAARSAYSDYLEADSQYRKAIIERNIKKTELDSFMLDLFTVAKVAFGKNAVELELLGID